MPSYDMCVCSSGWCEEASNAAAKNGLDQFVGAFRIPREKGGKSVGTDLEAMAGFVCDRWLHHVKAKKIDLKKQAFIRRVHFSQEALKMVATGRSISRFFELGRHITDMTTEADVCFKGNESKRSTLMVLPSMTRESAMAQVQPARASAVRIRAREDDATYRDALGVVGGSVGNSGERAVLAALVAKSPRDIQVTVKALIRADASEKERREQEFQDNQQLHEKARRNVQQLHQQNREEDQQLHNQERRNDQQLHQQHCKNYKEAIAVEKGKRKVSEVNADDSQAKLRDMEINFTMHKRLSEIALSKEKRQIERQSEMLRKLQAAHKAASKRKDSDLKDSHEDNKRLKAENAILRHDLNTEIKKGRVLIPAGLCLDNLLSKAWHADNKGAANVYFGHDTLEQHMADVDVLLPDTYHFARTYTDVYSAHKREDIEALKCALVKLEKQRQHKMRAASLCVLRMRMNLTMRTLQDISQWGKTKTSEAINTWIPKLGAASRLMVNVHMPLDLGRQLMPKDFVDGPLDDVFLIGDGKDIHIHEPRKAHNVRQKSYSTKEDCSCARGLSFMFPTGVYLIVFDLCLASATEPNLVRAFASKFDWLPPGCGILYDKGIKGNLRQVFKNLNPIYVPNFRKGKDYKYTEHEIGQNRGLSKLRYSVEVGYSRVANTRYVGERMSYNKLRLANAVWFYSHWHANIMRPLRK